MPTISAVHLDTLRLRLRPLRPAETGAPRALKALHGLLQHDGQARRSAP